MSFRVLKAVLLACSGIGVLLAATADANAGGLAVREQSAYGQGSSFAGVAAGGSLSSMFWNPATMTQMPGIQSESVLSGILPYSANTPNATSLFFALGGTGDTANDALVPAAYYSWQFRPNLWLGLSVNSPFGLSVNFPDAWAGRNYAAGSSSLTTYNATPSFAYRINDLISIGAGVQLEYAKADFTSGLPINGAGAGFPASLGNQFNINGRGWGFGFTAGITLTPTPTTTIGLGYRSAINQKINGTLTLPPGPAFTPAGGSTPGSVNTTLNLPDIVSLGIRQRVNPQLTLLGTVEWSNWSRIGTTAINQPSGAPATIVGIPVALPFQYKDGWFFSAGAEYQWNEKLAVRGGIGYEISPVTDQVREPGIPDNDRLWLSAGGTYKLTPKLSFDLAYSHIFVKSTHIDISAASGNPWFNPLVPIAYVGDVSSHVDIVSVAMKYRWDNPAPASKLIHK